MTKHPSTQEEPDDGSAPWSALRIFLVVASAALTVLSLAYLIFYGWNTHAKPSDIAVPTILFIGLGALAILVVPWKEIGFVPTEVFGFKFADIVNAQKKEQIDAIVPLQEEVKALQAKYEELSRAITGLDARSPGREIDLKGIRAPGQDTEEPPEVDAAAKRSDELQSLLLRFMRRYRGSFFSPLRIQRWGAAQKGFSDLGDFSKEEIRDALFKAVSENGVTTKISRKGSTLYGLSMRSDG